MNACYPFDRPWSLPDAVTLACQLEASAPKAGNVHPAASFVDMAFPHFLASSLAIRAAFENIHRESVGQVVLTAVQATQKCVGRNTNLGTVLLLAPMAKAFASSSPLTRQSVQKAIDNLTSLDCQLVYEAILCARPGGLGKSAQDDVHDPPPVSLVTAMARVADQDAVARQYVNGYADVFNCLIPWFEEALASGSDVADAICRLQIRWLANHFDGLILRKLDSQIALEVSRLAQTAWSEAVNSKTRITELQSYRRLDTFLRADGHRRNPGTTADLIAAALLGKLLMYRAD